MGAAKIHGMDIGHTLAAKPLADFKVAHDKGSTGFGQCHQVCHMVAVPVRHQDELWRQITGCHLSAGIVRLEKGIHYDLHAITSMLQVPWPSQVRISAICFLLCGLLPVSLIDVHIEQTRRQSGKSGLQHSYSGTALKGG